MEEYISRDDIEIQLSKRLDFLFSEYGSRDAYSSGFDEATDMILNAPAADVAPVRHGRWIECAERRIFGSKWLECSECKSMNGTNIKLNFCPNCGARMDFEDIDGGNEK